MSKIIEFKNLKVLRSFNEAAIPPNLPVGCNFPRGKEIHISFGAFGTEQYDKYFETFDQIDTKARSHAKKQGLVYNDIAVKRTSYETKNAKVDDLCHTIALTRVYENEKDGVKSFNEVVNKQLFGIEPKVLVKGKENEDIDFPYAGDTVDVKIELKQIKTNKGIRVVMIPHEINITELKPRTGNGGKGSKIEEVQIVEDSFLDELFGDSVEEVEVKPKKEEKKETKKTTAKPKTDKVDDEVSVDDIGEEDEINWDN